MALFETLTPAEQARQLANPEGAVGLAVADWLNENNKQANAKFVALLNVRPGARVLEIGFGNGRMAAEVMAQAADVTYAGVDISPPTVAEASTFNAALVAAGRAFTSVRQSGCRFPTAPLIAPSLSASFISGLTRLALCQKCAGFCDPAARCSWPVWRRGKRRISLERNMDSTSVTPQPGMPSAAAGFTDVHVETVEAEQITPGGAPVRRFGIIVSGCR